MIMNKTKLLTLAVLALLLLNFGLLGYFLYYKSSYHFFSNNREQKGGPKEIIIKKLHFDAIQTRDYQKLIDSHRLQIRTIEEKIRNSKNELYSLLKESDFNIKNETAIIDSLSSYQSQIELVHFKHFQDIKKLCKKDQLQDFNELTEQLSKLFSKRPKTRHDQ